MCTRLREGGYVPPNLVIVHDHQGGLWMTRCPFGGKGRAKKKSILFFYKISYPSSATPHGFTLGRLGHLSPSRPPPPPPPQHLLCIDLFSGLTTTKNEMVRVFDNARHELSKHNLPTNFFLSGLFHSESHKKTSSNDQGTTVICVHAFDFKYKCIQTYMVSNDSYDPFMHPLVSPHPPLVPHSVPKSQFHQNLHTCYFQSFQSILKTPLL